MDFEEEKMKKVRPKELIIRYDKDGNTTGSILTYQVYQNGTLLHKHRSISVKSVFDKKQNPEITDHQQFAEDAENVDLSQV